MTLTLTAPPAVHVARLSLAEVRALLEPQPAPCLSLYMPTHRRVPGNTVDVPAYRHLVESLELALAQGAARVDAARLLHPLRMLADDRGFWEHARDGLAVLAAGGAARVYPLDRPVPPLAVVGERFHTMPLLRLAATAERFHVLLLTSRTARLFAGTAWADPRGAAIEPLEPVPLVPQSGAGGHGTLSREDVVDEEIWQPHRVQRGMGIEGIVHGGVGAKRDDVAADTAIFLRFVADAVREQASRPTGLPLVLVAEPRLAAAYRDRARDPRLAVDHVASDPHLLTEEELRAALTPLFAAARGRRVARATRAFAQAGTRGRAAGDLAEVARAAVAGQVAALLIEADRYEPGRFEPATGAIEFAMAAGGDGPIPGDRSRTGDLPAVEREDLIGAVAQTVLRHGGTILALARVEMPTESGVAAIYRHA